MLVNLNITVVLRLCPKFFVVYFARYWSLKNVENFVVCLHLRQRLFRLFQSWIPEELLKVGLNFFHTRVRVCAPFVLVCSPTLWEYP